MSLYERTAVFEYDDFPGLTVTMRVSVPLREYLEVLAFMEDPAQLATLAGIARIGEIVDRYLVSWTLDGPAAEQPWELLLGIAKAWLRGVAEVPVPLPRRSSGIDTSPEASTGPES